ncbi:MAG: transposase [Phycisphaerales bacterium]|nr:MAG: transposase [Phycisphaerales bacterium]
MVTVIDSFGLKKWHLRRFRKSAEKLIRSTTERTFASKIAKDYQRRIVKYHDRLFEFLQHDNVAWNNNNAEHAIKRFAILRRSIGSVSTANGMQEHLVLLSICETLRRKHLSFLHFLLSQSVDLDRFADSSH